MNAILDHLERRRSTATVSLGPPGPALPDLERLLRIAARVPDHGSLEPWRMIVIEGDARLALSRHMIEGLADQAHAMSGSEREAAEQKIRKVFTIAPVIVVVVSHIVEGKGIPATEQLLSAGAVCMNLVIAATASGFGANWITGWAASHPVAHAGLRLRENETIAGLVLIGSQMQVQADRPRPALDMVVTYWTP